MKNAKNPNMFDFMERCEGTIEREIEQELLANKIRTIRGNRPVDNEKGITQHFGVNLAELLAEKILRVYGEFPAQAYAEFIASRFAALGYTQRVDLHADGLKKFLPADYEAAADILVSILGDENPNETGMFTTYYWILPIGRFVEKYGHDHYELSIKAIAEITKRNTGEYAIRPYIRKYPEKTVAIMKEWAKSESFHLRRLASEGLRPKLPWSQKLDTFIDNPEPVFQILELLKEDTVSFVKRSVANNIADYLKVNKDEAVKLLNRWAGSENKHTQWIIKHAGRKTKV